MSQAEKVTVPHLISHIEDVAVGRMRIKPHGQLS
jgi:hypothetical protein